MHWYGLYDAKINFPGSCKYVAEVALELNLNWFQGVEIFDIIGHFLRIYKICKDSINRVWKNSPNVYAYYL